MDADFYCCIKALASTENVIILLYGHLQPHDATLFVFFFYFCVTVTLFLANSY